MCRLSPCGHRPAERQEQTAAGTQPMAGNRRSTQRNPDARLLCENPASGGESSCDPAESEAPNCTGTQLLGTNPRAIPCCARRDSSRPFVTARVQEQMVPAPAPAPTPATNNLPSHFGSSLRARLPSRQAPRRRNGFGLRGVVEVRAVGLEREDEGDKQTPRQRKR